jgi:hypothetical protein
MTVSEDDAYDPQIQEYENRFEKEELWLSASIFGLLRKMFNLNIRVYNESRKTCQ